MSDNKQRILLLLILMVYTISNLSCNSNTEDTTRLNYQENLNEILNELESLRGFYIDSIENLVPISEEEFKILYAFFANPDTELQYQKFDSIIVSNAFQNRNNFLLLYLNMAEFIDSETVNNIYLENYYYNLDFIIENNSEKFCELFYSLPENKKNNLKDFSEDYCE